MRTSYTPSLCSHNPLWRRPSKTDGSRFTGLHNMLSDPTYDGFDFTLLYSNR